MINGINNTLGIENLSVDINSRKFAHDKTTLECAKEIMVSLFESINKEIVNAKELLEAAQKLFKEWHPLLLNYITDEKDFGEMIWFLQEYCTDSKFESLFAHILVFWYNIGLITIQSIFDWEKESLEGKERKFLDKASAFLQKLREQDSEEDTEEDEGETEEDDSQE